MTLASLCSPDPMISVLNIQDLAPSVHSQSGSQKLQYTISIFFLWMKLRINQESIIAYTQLKLKSLGIAGICKENVLVRSGNSSFEVSQRKTAEAPCGNLHEARWAKPYKNLLGKLNWINWDMESLPGSLAFCYYLFFLLFSFYLVSDLTFLLPQFHFFTAIVSLPYLLHLQELKMSSSRILILEFSFGVLKAL